jgi:hypothetical protein
MKEKIIVLTLLIILLLSTGSLVSIAEENQTDSIDIKYEFEEPKIIDLNIGDKEYNRIIIEGLSYSSEAGEPRLPVKQACILLPKDKDVSEITIFKGEKVKLGCDFVVEPIAESVPLSKISTAPKATTDVEIYNMDSDFPGVFYKDCNIHNFRGFNILFLKLYPVQYTPKTGELCYYKEFSIKLNLYDKKETDYSYRGLEKDKEAVCNIVDNPEIVESYDSSIISTTDENYNLLILTTDEFYDKFIPLKNAHDSNGIKTRIKTLSETGTNINMIKNFIENEYLESGIEYVLLGADEHLLPTKPILVDLDPGSIPSDQWYANLNGDDLLPEVFIGRAAVEYVYEAENFVSKTVQYMYDDFVREYYHVTLAGAKLSEKLYGGDCLDELVDNSNANGYVTAGIPSSIFFIDKLYDRTWQTGDWPKQELIDRINDNTHIINFNGHSHISTDMKIKTSDIDECLTNTNPCFVYSQGCYAGAFDNINCFAEYFTLKNTHGGFAGIWNTRSGWGDLSGGTTNGPSHRFNRNFWDAVFGEGHTEIGVALQYSKIKNLAFCIPGTKEEYCYWELTLFGDPAVKLKTPQEFIDSKPTIEADFTVTDTSTSVPFTFKGIHPDNEDIYLYIDWGNGETEGWIGPFESGEEVKRNKKWDSQGLFYVRARIKDDSGSVSPWSDPLEINCEMGRIYGSVFHQCMPASFAKLIAEAKNNGKEYVFENLGDGGYQLCVPTGNYIVHLDAGSNYKEDHQSAAVKLGQTASVSFTLEEKSRFKNMYSISQLLMNKFYLLFDLILENWA